jgi:hypothetical protein
MYERGYETSGSPLHFMLRRSSLVECVSVLYGTSVYKASMFFFFDSMFSHFSHPKISLGFEFLYVFTTLDFINCSN